MIESLRSHGYKDATPLVTVAMPVYNAGEYLRLAVLSIVRQTFLNWELLIIDDGSTDDAFRVIADIGDPRIRIFRDGKNKGLAARLNECIDLARGKYLARMDQDDVSFPERFARQVEALQKDPCLDLLAVRAITIDGCNKASGMFPSAIMHDEICAKPWRGFYFPHPTWMGKIEWFRRHHYAEPGPYFCEDQELLLRSYRESRFATIDEILFAYRIRGKTNWRKLAKTRQAIAKIQLRHFADLKQWHLMLLAMGAYAVKSASDALKRLANGNIQPGRRSVDDSVLFKWDNTLEILSAEEKLP